MPNAPDTRKKCLDSPTLLSCKSVAVALCSAVRYSVQVRIGAIAPILLVTAACSGKYLVEALDSENDSGRVAGNGDAATNSSDTAPPEAALGSDAGSPCTGSDLFCDDFDRGALGATWDAPALTGGLLDLVNVGCSSPPTCLSVSLDRYQNGDQVELSRALSFPPNGLSVEADITVTGGADLGPLFVDLSAPPGTRFRHFTLQYGTSTLAISAFNLFDDGGRVGDYKVASSVVTGRRHVSLRLTANDGTISAALKVDSERQVIAQLAGPPPTRVTVRVGAPLGADRSTARVTVDDVIVKSL